MEKNVRSSKRFSRDALKIDAELETERICTAMRDLVFHRLKRRGVVLGISGGIDSSVTAALAVRALGPNRLLGLEMPERDSDPETLSFSGLIAQHLGFPTVLEEISGILDAAGCYRRYDAAVRSVIPEYGPGWKSKLVIQERKGFHVFNLVAQAPDSSVVTRRLPVQPYLEIVAATNFKQRTRKMLEYHHADRLHYAVAGTPNRLEFDQGFFVKLGDGAADIKPIAHLYKSQVYQLAEYLGIPETIRQRPPTTDTYSLAQGQEEFYFSLSFEQMDLCLFGINNGISPEEVTEGSDLTLEQVREAYHSINAKRSTTRYLHLPPLLIEAVPEIGVTKA